MVQDALRSSGGLSTTAVSNGGGRGRGLLRGWQVQNTSISIKIMILCGFVTILVLLGTVSIGNLGNSNADEVNQNLFKETDTENANSFSVSETEPIPAESPSESDSAPTDFVEPTKAEVNTPTDLVEPTKAEINPPTALVELTRAEVNPPTDLVEPTKAEVNPPTDLVEPTRAEVSPPTALEEPQLPKAEVNPPTVLVEPTRAKANPPTALEESPKAEVSPNVTYTLGPKITNWDSQRKVWLTQNPGFPSIVHGKPRIMLLTGSPPGPCDKPIGDYYLLKSVKNKIDYCRLHGIEIMYNMAHLDEELSGYWTKLPMIRRLMLSHPEVEWIWWMDSDALFTDILFEIPLSRYEKHNLVIHGYPDLLYNQKSWVALNTGVFLLRNCQWSLDLLDAWAPMGPKGPVRDEAGKILTAYLKGRPAFEADDQSALIYLLLSQKDTWMDKVYVENQYYLHGFWEGLVDKYEEMMEKNHPGLGDERWPFVTHFVGCKPCGSYADYAEERCFKSMERAFNFADNQVMKVYGFSHRGLLSLKVKRIRNETVSPLEFVDRFDIRRAHEETKP